MVTCVLEYSSVHTAVVPSSNNTSFDVLMPRFLVARHVQEMFTSKWSKRNMHWEQQYITVQSDGFVHGQPRIEPRPLASSPSVLTNTFRSRVQVLNQRLHNWHLVHYGFGLYQNPTAQWQLASQPAPSLHTHMWNTEIQFTLGGIVYPRAITKKVGLGASSHTTKLPPPPSKDSQSSDQLAF
jgi:hypothetical protein